MADRSVRSGVAPVAIADHMADDHADRLRDLDISEGGVAVCHIPVLGISVLGVSDCRDSVLSLSVFSLSVLSVCACIVLWGLPCVHVREPYEPDHLGRCDARRLDERHGMGGGRRADRQRRRP